MKKLILMLFLVVGVVTSVKADGEMWLRSDLNGGSWTGNLDTYQFSKNWDSTNSQDIYELTIGSDKLIAGSDFYFRLFRNGNNYETCPYQNKNYTYTFSDGHSETYSATSGSDFQGTSGAFCVSHSTIKANEYKITVYVKYDNPWKYYIKVDIVDMPAPVSALGYSTFSCNRALDFSEVTALSAYKASVNEGKVVLTKVDGKVAANTGLLLAGASANIPVVPTAEGEDISATNLLKASVTETEVAASGTDGKYHYFLAGTSASDIGFYNVAEAATSGAGKAYLETTTALASEPASARVAWVFQDDETTGIKDATRSLTTNDVFFDLTGRRVKALRGGLYIKNGKKVIVK